jgi:hypothetical protein
LDIHGNLKRPVLKIDRPSESLFDTKKQTSQITHSGEGNSVLLLCFNFYQLRE